MKLTEHTRLTDLCFADDVALIDDCIGGLQMAMDSVTYWAEKIELSVNLAKSRWMAVGLNANNENGFR